MTDQTPENTPPRPPASAIRTAVVADPILRPGLPRWAWPLIIASALVCVGIVATIVVIVGIALGASSAADCGGGGCDSEGTSITRGKSAQSPSPLAEGGERISLDALAAFDGQPVWASQLAPSWRMVTFDDNGVNVFQDDDTGCLLLTSQTVASETSVSPTDSLPSDQMINDTIAAYKAKDPDALVMDFGRADVTLAASRPESTIEFSTATVARTTPSGEPQTVEIIARTMPDSGTSLVATLSCDPSVHAAADLPYGALTTALAVVLNP
ncbi:hypothetical protein AB0O95_03885 [Rhodoglobus sp. NPDC076762]